MAAVDLARLREHGKRFVDGFTPGQKAMTLLGVVAVVFAGMFFMKWAAATDYATLYSGLSAQDAASVTQQLDAQHVSYKLANGGDTILVARPDVYKTRISLSAKGVPSGGDSFTMLDKAGITTDQFTRNVDYQRALQAELSKTIESIDSVAAASVTLTIPQDTVFVGANEDKATAAVLVKPRGGALSDSTVQAIVNLVASSIPHMSTDDVTVADSNGNVLHAPGMDTSLTSSTQIAQKNLYESAIQKKLTDMIAATLGPGHAAVTVNADLDMSKHDTTSNTYTEVRPGQTVPVSENNTSEQLSQPGNGTTGGQLGLNGQPAAGTGTSATSYQKTATQQNNALNSTQDSATTPPGTVKRLSVSVLLDNGVVPASQIATWTNQLSAAAGIDAKRDGTNAMQVTTLAFDKSAQKAAQQQLSSASGGANGMFDLIKHVLTLMMIGLVLFFAWRAIKKADANRIPLRVPLDLRELEAPADFPMPIGAAVAAALPARASPERRPLPAGSGVEEEITDLIARQPDEVAQTLRSWLADRRS